MSLSLQQGFAVGVGIASFLQMVEDKDVTSSFAAVTPDTDDAVGVPGAKWFIAIVNNRSEKLSGERLSRMGIENYVATQRQLCIRSNGKRAEVERVVIPSKIFIRCTEAERRSIVNLPFIFRFMVNRAGKSKNALGAPLAVVSNAEIEQLKFMLGVEGAKVEFSERYVKGDLVEVIRGPFRGLTGIVLKDSENRKSHLHINLDFLGSASVEIDPRDVAKTNKQTSR